MEPRWVSLMALSVDRPPIGFECPLLATSGHVERREESPLYPQLRTFRGPRWTSVVDPTRTFRIRLANRHEPKTNGAGMVLGSKNEGRRHLRTNGPLAIVFRSTQLGICAGRQPQHLSAYVCDNGFRPRAEGCSTAYSRWLPNRLPSPFATAREKPRRSGAFQG